MNLSGAKVVVVGMARSGVAAVELLLAKGAHVRALDQKPVAIPNLRVKVELQEPSAFTDADLIVLSPGVPADLPEIEQARWRGIRVVGDLELASWYLQGGVIGITGSNGKTTTTALTGHILGAAKIPAQVGGNIGRPPASMVATSTANQWNVLELSSFQLETTDTFRAHIGAALNVTPDHLDRHYTLENYIAAKGKLFAHQQSSDFRVLNAEDQATRSYASIGNGSSRWFSSLREATPGSWLRGTELMLNGEPFMDASEVPLRGLHNLENTMAAAIIASLAGAKATEIRTAIRSFPGVEHRLEFVEKIEGVEWYNDSKATNVDATLKALAAFPGNLWVILGGKDKNSDYTPLAGPLREKARAALLIGAAAPKIAEQLRGALDLVSCETLENAIQVARMRSRHGDAVVLAPACASFDQFENFEHRGREFKRLVRRLHNG